MRNVQACGLVMLALLGLVHGACAQDEVVALKASKVYVGDGRVIENGTVLIRGGKIIAVGANVEIPAGADLQEHPGGTITAGLIDAATDAGTRGAMKSGSAAEHVSETTPEYRVVDAVDLQARELKDLAREGVTTVFVTGDRGSVIGGQGTVVKTGGGRTARVLVETSDLKATMTTDPQFTGSFNSDPFGQSATMYNRRPTTQMGTVWVFREAMHAAKNRKARGEKLTPHDAELTTAMAGHKRFRFLARQQHEIHTSLRLAAEFGLKIVIEQCDEAWRSIPQIKAAGVPVIFGPVNTGNSGFGLARRWSTPRRLLDAGVTLALTSARASGENGLARQAMYAMRYGLSRDEALRAVTSTPAALLGVGDEVGSVKVGFDADVIVWSGEPFDGTSRQKVVYIGGVPVSGKVF